MDYIIISQGFGFIGVFVLIAAFQQNTNKRIAGLLAVSGIFWGIHYIMLGAFTGAALNALGISRNFVFFCRPRKWANSKLWLYFFCAAYMGAGIFTYESPISMFPVMSMIIGTIAIYLIDTKITRRLSLVASLGWMVYNAVNFSVAGVVAEISALISIIIAMIKFDFKKRTEG